MCIWVPEKVCSLFSGFLKGCRLGSAVSQGACVCLAQWLNQSLACAGANNRSEILFVLAGVFFGPVKDWPLSFQLPECPGLRRAVIKACVFA